MTPAGTSARFALPFVYVTPRHGNGVYNPRDTAPPMEAHPWGEVFTRHYDFDAHFVVYYIPGEQTLPRINKAFLPHARNAGAEIFSSMIVLDWDTPGHVPLTSEIYQTYLELLGTMAAAFPLAMQWNHLFTTRNGLRLVYLLDRPTPVDQTERHIRWLVQQFQSRGAAIDDHCCDWTRLFRLPYVTRDKQATWEDDKYGRLSVQHLHQSDDPIAVAGLGVTGMTRGMQIAEIKPITNPKPAPDISCALLEVVTDKGIIAPTPFAKEAKRLLRGRECYSCLYEMEPIAQPGNRDDTIHKHVGQTITLLYHVDGCSPEHIYALFLETVLQLEPDTQTRDWTDILWSSVCRLWAKEAAKNEQVQIDRAVASEREVDLSKSLIEGMRNWCSHPDLGDPTKSAAFLMRHLIVSVASSFFVMRNDGTYDPTPLAAPQVIAAIRSRHMDLLIPTTFENSEGVTQDRTIQSIVNEHATVAAEMWAEPGDGGAWIKGIDTDAAQFQIPAYCRNPMLVATYNANVDMWLRKMGGKDYPLLEKWLSRALDFEGGPICALSIVGKAGSGKKLLVVGLSECLKQPRIASSEDMVGDNNYGLLASPFLSIDEGWVKSGKGRHPADQFRALVAGDNYVIKRKYMPPTHITNSVRIIFTSNNMEILKVLTHRRELSPADREALSQRLLHINITDEAADWLAEMGGVAFTGKTGERWIRGDGGQESDFVVAKHLMWLYERREAIGAAGKRFLVEGNASEEVMLELRTGAGSSPLVLETVIQMLEKPTTWDGLAIVDDRLYASAAEVLGYYRNNLQDKARVSLTAEMVNNAFRGMSAGGDGGPRVLPTREHLGVRQWHELDCGLLLRIAMRDAWKCDKLRSILAHQRGAVGTVGLGATDIMPEKVNGYKVSGNLFNNILVKGLDTKASVG